MKRIDIVNGLSTGLRQDFDVVISVEVGDRPFAVGGFGEVYHCVSINGAQLTIPQVIKIFIDNSRGSSMQNFETTQRLQRKFELKNRDLITTQNTSLVEEYPAFRGVPQFSFAGRMNGKSVLGFMSDNLVEQGFIDFEHFLQDSSLLDRYQHFPLERKILISYQLVSAFKILEEFRFIHADLKPGALFINLNSGQIALIDFDSGVITENVDDEPLTWGAANDWVAPEIWEQQSSIQPGDKIRVDVYSDRWSVAIGIHYLLTTFHPLFFLRELSPRVAKQYFTPSNRWPHILKTSVHYQTANDGIYDQYVPWIEKSLPAAVRNVLFRTINFGYQNPVARSSYSDWKNALQAIQAPPKINKFISNRTAVIQGMEVDFTWDVENAHTVVLDGDVVQPANKGSVRKKVHTNTCVQLDAIGHFGEARADIEVRVFPTPVLESVFVPIPQISQSIKFNARQISSPKIDVSIGLKNPFIEKLRTTDLTTDFKSVKPIHLPKTSIFNLSKLYEAVRRRVSE